MRKSAELLDQLRNTIVATYQWHSELSDEELVGLMDAETWMDADETIANGFATEKVEGLEGVRFLIVQPLDREQKPVGRPVVAGDAVAMAGPGELVYIVGSREAALAMPEPFNPVDHAIVGIVDAVERSG